MADIRPLLIVVTVYYPRQYKTEIKGQDVPRQFSWGFGAILCPYCSELPLVSHSDLSFGFGKGRKSKSGTGRTLTNCEVASQSLTQKSTLVELA